MSADTNKEPGSGPLRTILPSLIVLVAVVTVGYLTLNRLTLVDERLAEFDQRVEDVSERTAQAISAANEAQGTASTALERAVGAESNAAAAAGARAEAEESRRVAENARLTAEAAAAEAEIATGEAEEVARLATEEAGLARRDLERVERERQEELDRLQQALGAIVETRRTAIGLVMSLDSDAIEFAFDSSDLGGRDRELLSRIAGILLTSGGFSVGVYGHTDDVGSDEYNQELSERRAQSVRDYLVGAGVNSNIVSTLGYGKSSPRVEGTTSAARAQNRRVEIAIIDVTLGPAREVDVR